MMVNLSTLKTTGCGQDPVRIGSFCEMQKTPQKLTMKNLKIKGFQEYGQKRYCSHSKLPGSLFPGRALMALDMYIGKHHLPKTTVLMAESHVSLLSPFISDMILS